MKKQQLAQEFIETRKALNELKRKESLLREFFLEDMGEKKTKTYGDVVLFLTDVERERFDREKLHLSYPDIFEQFVSTYVSQTLRYMEK